MVLFSKESANREALDYLVVLRLPQSIFDVATQYAFAGYAALSPLLVAALFWKRSTRWSALAVTLWTAGAVLAVAVLQIMIPPPPPGQPVPVLSVGGLDVITREAGGAMVLGFLPVVPMTIVSSLLMVAVSWLTQRARPTEATLRKYFEGSDPIFSLSSRASGEKMGSDPLRREAP